MRRTLSQYALGLLAMLSLSSRVQALEVRNVRLWAQPDSTRVVLDLSANTKSTVTVLHSPERVIIDIPQAKLAKSARLPHGSGAVKQVRTMSNGSQMRLVLDLAHA